MSSTAVCRCDGNWVSRISDSDMNMEVNEVIYISRVKWQGIVGGSHTNIQHENTI